MKWLALILLVGCRTQPLEVGTDGAPLPDLSPLPDLTPAFCGGFAGFACPPKQFCEIPAGQCFNDSGGTCKPIPSICGHDFNPVCGCNNNTYTNDCERQQAGVPLAYEGECEQLFDSAIPVDLARPADLAYACAQTCDANQYCFVGCCGTPNCTPPAPTCDPLPTGCAGCGCLPNSGGCTCTEDAAGRLTYTCTLCP